MGFRQEREDRVEAVAYAREASAEGVLRDLNYLTADQFSDEPRVSYGSDIYQTYKVTIIIEKY